MFMDAPDTLMYVAIIAFDDTAHDGAERVRAQHIIMVEKSDVLSTRRLDAYIGRAGYARVLRKAMHMDLIRGKRGA